MDKTGHWILDSIVSMDNTNIKTFIYKCSECGFYVNNNRIDVCRHCGAKMNNQEKGKNNMDLLNDTKGIRHQATELIEQAYHKGYKAGVEDGKNCHNDNVIFTNGIDSVVITTLCKDCKFRTNTGICEKLRLNETDGNFILKVHRTHDMDHCSLGKSKYD